MIYMDVDTALPEVPVNSVPLTDDSDFKTLETAVAYNASGMALNWHFVTKDGNYTVTAVTPTTGGDYDWAHQGQGMYSIAIPASAGASINNDTEGYGWFTGFVTGVLPFRGPTITLRPASINNALVIGSAYLGANVLQFGSSNGSFAGGRPAVNTTHFNGTAATASGGQPYVQVPRLFGLAPVTGTIGATGNDTTHLHLDGLTYADDELNGLMLVIYDSDAQRYYVTWIRDWVNATALATVDTLPFTPQDSTDTYTILVIPESGGASAAAIADAVLDEALSGHTTAGTLGKAISDIEVDTAEIGTAGAGLTEAGGTGDHLTDVPWNASWDAEVQSEVQDAIEANHLDHLLAVTYDPASKPGAADALLNELIENDAGVSRYTANALEQAPTGGSAPSAADIADAVWDEATSGHTTSGTFGEQLKTNVDAILDDTGTAGVVVASGSKTGYSLTAGTGLGNQTADITGSLSGSVGSVSGAVGSVTGNVGGNVTGTIGGLTAAAIADLFDTDSGTTYGSAVAGSVVKEIADNAGGSGLTAAGIADAVWDEAQSGHTTAGTFGKYLDQQVSTVDTSGGSGSVSVNHDYGGTNALRVVDGNGAGVDEASIRAYLTSDYDAGNTSSGFVVASAITDVNGYWVAPMLLDPEDYTIVAFKQGVMQTTVTEITVS